MMKNGSSWLVRGAAAVLVGLLAACSTDASWDDVDLEDADDEGLGEYEGDPAEQGGDIILDSPRAGLTPLTQPIRMRSGAWWGDVKTPLINQVWGEVLNATPGKTITGKQTISFTCDTPKFDGFSQTLQLSNAIVAVDSKNVYTLKNPGKGQVISYDLDPSKFSAGWHEIRIRCKAKETVGKEKGKVTAITAGYPLRFNSGTKVDNHSGTDFVDTHGWYDRGVGYAYATILNISDVVGKPLKGVVNLDLTARVSGDTVLNHFMVKVDDNVVTMPDGRPAEFTGSTGKRTIAIDTRKYSNGKHVLAMHSHGIEKPSSEEPGQQIAAEIQVTIDIRN